MYIHKKDEFGLLPEEIKDTPYVAIYLDNEDVEFLKNKKAIIYKTDGRSVFDVRDTNKNKTGNVMFILFVEN